MHLVHTVVIPQSFQSSHSFKIRIMRVQLLLAAMTAVVLANPAPQFGKGSE